jgi:cell division protein FtsI/penicillin-binding protein 2
MVIHEGMRMTTNYPGGTARPLERKDVAIAAKSGTAELGAGNAYVNSWAAGFFPYEEPTYAFILMMDKAPRSNALGGTRVMGDIVQWMSENTPWYLGIESEAEAIKEE